MAVERRVMLVSRVRTRSMQETLRALGAVLDAHRARSVCILEVSSGLLVRAAVADTLGDRIGGIWQPLERLYPDSTLFEQQVAAVARRGTGHQAGPIERSLRLIGRAVDEQSLTRLTIIQHHHDAGWVVWYDGPEGTQTHLFAMSTDELATLDTQLRARSGRSRQAVVGDV
jgi:hypothetical protein